MLGDTWVSWSLSNLLFSACYETKQTATILRQEEILSILEILQWYLGVFSLFYIETAERLLTSPFM